MRKRRTMKPGWVDPRIGRPNPAKRPAEERFWERVDKNGPNGCWIFRARLTNCGYCHHYLSGSRKRGDYKEQLAHRYSWELHNGPIPDGLVIDHLCRVRNCVNPAHMRVVTFRQNTLENNTSPIAAKAVATHCQNGHEFTRENTALIRYARKKKDGTRGPERASRLCLTCYPGYWRYAIVPRPRLPTSQWLPTDPDYDQRPNKTPPPARNSSEGT